MNDDNNGKHTGSSGWARAQADFHREAREWGRLLLGGMTVGPVPPDVALQQWAGLQAQGVDPERLSSYAVTADGRSIYFAGPHTAEGPRGLHLEGGRVTLRGADERGAHVVLRGLVPELVEVFVFVDDGGDL